MIETGPLHHQQISTYSQDHSRGSARSSVSENLSRATQKTTELTVSAGLAYAEPQESVASEDFSFGDILDMVNPLQHIPLVNSMYRSITGDEIKPMSKVMGGAVFGGGIGAASGLVNIMLEHETGKDLTSNFVSFVDDGNGFEKPATAEKPSDHPEKRLNEAAKNLEQQVRGQSHGLPENVIGFTDIEEFKNREPITELHLNAFTE